MPSRNAAAAEKLRSLKAVFSREGAERVREEVQSMGQDSLRSVSASAGLPSRAGGAWITTCCISASFDSCFGRGCSRAGGKFA